TNFDSVTWLLMNTLGRLKCSFLLASRSQYREPHSANSNHSSISGECRPQILKVNSNVLPFIYAPHGNRTKITLSQELIK
ncbi:hypothetical protein L9F63_008320, partial [Diploptera punctata]